MDNQLQNAIRSNVARINRLEVKNEELRQLRLLHSMETVTLVHEFQKIYGTPQSTNLIEKCDVPQSRPATAKEYARAPSIASSRPASARHVTAPIADPTPLSHHFYPSSSAISFKSSRPQTASILVTGRKTQSTDPKRPKTSKLRWKDEMAV